MSKFPLVRFENAALQIIDGDRGTNYPQKTEFHNSGYCVFLNTGNVTTSGFDFGDVDFISEEKDALLRKGKASKNDIVLTTRGTVGNVAFYGDAIRFQNIRINSGMVLIRTAQNEIDPYYLYAFLRSAIFQKQVSSNGSGSAQPQLPISALKNISFPLPNIETQQKIAAVLSALDAKIDCNNRINAELEAMAKTLYDYWFVQFDFPFDFAQGRPDANGKPYKSSGGKMVYNAILKREIPAGWEAATLSQFVGFERGVTYGKEDVCTSDAQNSIGILRATNVTGNVVDVNDLVFVPASKVSAAQILKKFETLIVMSSGSKEHVGKNGIYYFDEPRGFGAFCSKITASSNHRFFVNTFLQSPWFKAHIKNSCLGTNINNLTNDHINDCLIAKPDAITLQLFENKVGVCYEKISNNARENQYLTQLRDWLLPMLMNGQVTVM